MVIDQWLLTQPGSQLDVSIQEFLKAIFIDYLPLGIPNVNTFERARDVLNILRRTLSEFLLFGTYTENEINNIRLIIISISNHFYQMIPSIGFRNPENITQSCRPSIGSPH